MCFDKKCVFVVLAGKYVFCGFDEKIEFLRFWREILYGGFGEKCVFDEKVFLWV